MRAFAVFAAALLFTAPAGAVTIDFTDPVAWGGANPASIFPPIPTPTFTVANAVGSGVDVTATVIMGTSPIGGPSLINDVGTQTTGNLPNGLGVAVGIDSSEIDRVEILRISFSTPVVVDSFLASRFFTQGASGDVADEQGIYTLEGLAGVTFTANNNDPEGRQLITVGGGAVNFIDFSAPGPLDNDYSLVNLSFTVPEPGVAVLLTGLLLAVHRARKR